MLTSCINETLFECNILTINIKQILHGDKHVVGEQYNLYQGCLSCNISGIQCVTSYTE